VHLAAVQHQAVRKHDGDVVEEELGALGASQVGEDLIHRLTDVHDEREGHSIARAAPAKRSGAAEARQAQ